MALITENTANTAVEINTSPTATLFFNDGVRSVDFVLVWDTTREQTVTDLAVQKRMFFEMNLEHEGLDLEYEEQETNGLNFIKIHVPLEVVRRYSEFLKLRMPMRELLGKVERRRHPVGFILKRIECLRKKVEPDQEVFPLIPQYFTAIYSRDKDYLFDIKSKDFFTPIIRARIVQYILERQRYSDDEKDVYAFGINNLIKDKVYDCAYPLHDGSCNVPGSMRYLLYTEWASLRRWYRLQPLDYVKEYFGAKIALYFAWLGFYTYMLIPVSLIGIGCFSYSLSTFTSHKPWQDVCGKMRNVIMCPECDKCDYWKLGKKCFYIAQMYMVDNPSTIIFATVMSLWAVTFVELWKKYAAEITYRWDLIGYDIHEDNPRPKYLAHLKNVKKTKINNITNQMEPDLAFWKFRLLATFWSASFFLLLGIVATVAVIGLYLFRIATTAALALKEKEIGEIKFSDWIVEMSASFVNFLMKKMFDLIFDSIVRFLTELELQRTQTEFEDSLILKTYLFRFTTTYSSMFNIAFVMDYIDGYPAKYNRLFGYRLKSCEPGGCMYNLWNRMLVFVVMWQFMNTVQEMVCPLWSTCWKARKIRKQLTRNDTINVSYPQWMKDYPLLRFGQEDVRNEFLEMVLQYGYITLFVSAFPLAPSFALVNNIFEMRLDAKKLLKYHKRPVMKRVKDIGIWYRILSILGKLAVLTNGFIIAFTSDFIPQVVYVLTLSSNRSLEGYMNFTLVTFNSSILDVPKAFKSFRNPNVTSCKFAFIREPHSTWKDQSSVSIWWKILAARLAFVVSFMVLMILLTLCVRGLLRMMPSSLKSQIRREEYITNEIIVRETEIARAGDTHDRSHLRSLEHLLGLSGPQFDIIMQEIREKEITKDAQRRKSVAPPFLRPSFQKI